MGGKISGKSLLDLFVELVDTINGYFRQESKRTLDDSVIKPLHRIKNKMVFGIIAAVLLGVSAIFLSVALFLLLANAVGSYWLALMLIGAVLLVGGLVLIGKAR